MCALERSFDVLQCRQREAEAAEERSVQEYLRKRREREAAQAAQQANKREAQDRCKGWDCVRCGWAIQAYT